MEKKQTRNKKVYFEMTSIFSSFHIMRALCDTIFSNKWSALPLYLIYLAMLVITVMEININVGWGAEQSKYHGTAAIEARSLPVMLPLSQTNKQWIWEEGNILHQFSANQIPLVAKQNCLCRAYPQKLSVGEC